MRTGAVRSQNYKKALWKYHKNGPYNLMPLALIELNFGLHKAHHMTITTWMDHFSMFLCLFKKTESLIYFHYIETSG